MDYVYKDDDGCTFTFDFPMGEAPERIDVEGITYRRVYTAPAISFKGSGFYSTSGR